MSLKGFDDFAKKLEKLAKNASQLDGNHAVSLPDLLTPGFVSKHTKFAGVSALFAASGFKIETPEDLAVIPDGEWDAYIRSVSDFQDWKAMMSAAVSEWTKRKMQI